MPSSAARFPKCLKIYPNAIGEISFSLPTPHIRYTALHQFHASGKLPLAHQQPTSILAASRIRTLAPMPIDS
ncbi:hypothetical protein [Rubritalea tangerina]|uniref:hypothetical protein n=1 Tax=Rubritalea tangerina TaxID=430798 RepID=UPI00360A0D37